MAQYIKKVSTTPTRGNGFIINSFNTNDNKELNAPSLAAVEDRTDNNLLLCGAFSNTQTSGAFANGWKVTPKNGYTGTLASFSPVVGLYVPGYYDGYLTTPKFAALDGWTLDRLNTPYSFQIVFRTSSSMSSEPIIGKVENIIGSASPVVDATFDGKLHVVIGTLLGGGGLTINITSATSTPLYIQAIKLERGSSCTPIEYNGKEYGIVNLVSQIVGEGLPRIVTIEGTFETGADGHGTEWITVPSGFTRANTVVLSVGVINGADELIYNETNIEYATQRASVMVDNQNRFAFRYLGVNSSDFNKTLTYRVTLLKFK